MGQEKKKVIVLSALIFILIVLGLFLSEYYNFKTNTVGLAIDSLCVSNWECSTWGRCISSSQNRSCIDGNNCSNPTNIPALEQKCECIESWQCTFWEPAECIGNQTQSRICNDMNKCKSENKKPILEKKCNQIAKEVENCFDGKLNQEEDDVDCGGACDTCETKIKASCFDGVQNQGEEEIDCGGVCEVCEKEEKEKKIIEATCYDGIKNQGEEDIDCGGPCEACDEIETYVKRILDKVYIIITVGVVLIVISLIVKIFRTVNIINKNKRKKLRKKKEIKKEKEEKQVPKKNKQNNIKKQRIIQREKRFRERRRKLLSAFDEVEPKEYDQAISVIKGLRKKGFSDSVIKGGFLIKGWKEKEIDRLMRK